MIFQKSDLHISIWDPKGEGKGKKLYIKNSFYVLHGLAFLRVHVVLVQVIWLIDDIFKKTVKKMSLHRRPFRSS